MVERLSNAKCIRITFGYRNFNKIFIFKRSMQNRYMCSLFELTHRVYHFFSQMVGPYRHIDKCVYSERKHNDRVSLGHLALLGREKLGVGAFESPNKSGIRLLFSMYCFDILWLEIVLSVAL